MISVALAGYGLLGALLTISCNADAMFLAWVYRTIAPLADPRGAGFSLICLKFS